MQARKAEARKAEERRERERRELEAAKKEANGADKLASSLEELRAKLLVEQRGRREAELALADTRDRIESQRRHAQQAAADMRKQAEQLPSLKQAEPRKPPPVAAPAAASAEDESELKRQLEEALERLRNLEEELKKKETQWRLTSLKRHAETNKLEQAIKVSQKNEGLLKKKADMLELSLMSHQKSMEKGRAKMVQDQLKERNGQLEQQHELSDIHANASKRKTFTQTFDLQMKTLDSKLAECK